MKIYTSYFAKLKVLPPNIVPIAICAKVPFWYKGLHYPKLAPKYDFFIQWKKDHDNARFTEHYRREVLDGLNLVDVLSELRQLAPGKDIALICYEKPSDFCHRHIISDWFNQWLGICSIWVEGDIIEWK